MLLPLRGSVHLSSRSPPRWTAEYTQAPCEESLGFGRRLVTRFAEGTRRWSCQPSSANATCDILPDSSGLRWPQARRGPNDVDVLAGGGGSGCMGAASWWDGADGCRSPLGGRGV